MFMRRGRVILQNFWSLQFVNSSARGIARLWTSSLRQVLSLSMMKGTVVCVAIDEEAIVTACFAQKDRCVPIRSSLMGENKCVRPELWRVRKSARERLRFAQNRNMQHKSHKRVPRILQGSVGKKRTLRMPAFEVGNC